MKKISCVIPALNEEKQIANVLDAVLKANKKNPMEIIVVDDGSWDKTPEILKTYKNIKVITNKRNMGKSYAVAKGLEGATGEYVLLLDADLIGLTAENILTLLYPIQTDAVQVTMSIRKNSYPHTRMIKLDCLTGERVFPRKIIVDQIDNIKELPNFALEVFLNHLVIEQGYAVRNIYWGNVYNHYKYRKRGLYTGLKADFLLHYDISKVISAKGWILQNIALMRLSTKSSAE